MKITGATYTTVNRRITEGRRALRAPENDRENAARAEGGSGRETAPPA